MCIAGADQITEPTARVLRQNEAGREKVCGPPPPCGDGKPKRGPSMPKVARAEELG